MGEVAQNSSNSLVAVRDVTMRYPMGDSFVEAVRGVTLSIAAEERLAIVGRSGSGKTTLLNLIGALERPTSGNVSIAGADVSSLDDTKLAQLRNREIGFVFQTHHLLPQCTALENVLVPTLVSRDSGRAAVRSRAEMLLDRVGMADRMFHRPGQLSGGQMQRVGLVRALINQPSLVLADEPTGSLDQTTADAIMHLLDELQRDESFALVMVSHAPDLAARMDRTITLSDGQVVEDTTFPAAADTAAS